MRKFIYLIVGLLVVAFGSYYAYTTYPQWTQGNVSKIAFGGLESVASVSGTSVRLNWTNVEGAKQYFIFNTTSGKAVQLAAVNAPADSYTVTNLTPSSPYKFRVRLVDAKGLTDNNVIDKSITTSSVTATFNGWSGIKAVGAKVPAPQALDMKPMPAAVTLMWNAMTLSSGTVESYNIYRSTVAGKTSATPLATKIPASTRSYTDKTVKGGSTYYYTIAPVVANSVVVIPLSSADGEVAVIVPNDNMVLIHRWAANLQLCEQMGKKVDRDNNYRCAVFSGSQAPPGTGQSGYMDVGHSLFVDAYEQGCNYSYNAKEKHCGSPNGCIGNLLTPEGKLQGHSGEIYYSRMTGRCFINSGAQSGNDWVAANAASAAQLKLMASTAPGLPPLVFIDQTHSQHACSGQTVSGFKGTKRLLTHKEQVIASAWRSNPLDTSISDDHITTMENGTNLDTTHFCNSNYADPQGNNTVDVSAKHPSLAFDNQAFPKAIDTLPGCLNSDCASSKQVAIRSFRTGSNTTQSCVSAFGAQDLIGNVWEWSSDQVTCKGTTCSGVTANEIDPTNTDWNGVNFDNRQGPAKSNSLSHFGSIQFPIGIPIAEPSFNEDGIVSRKAAQFHGDSFWITEVPAGPRGARAGGSWSAKTYAGRFTLHLASPPFATYPDIGFRCAIPAVTQ